MTAAQSYYEETDLDVVKVTVDRREKSLQSYAGSASAYTEEDLARVGVNSVRTLGNANPSLEIGTQEGNSEITIRGVGSYDNTEVNDPAVATYFDGIYIPRPRGVGSMFFDLERVEINRGPQGTVRGRNATGGAINIVSAKPKLGEFSSNGELQYGNYSQKLGRAMVNIPLAPTLALRIAAFSENHDPFYKNGGPVYTITPAESADSLAYRAGALWKPSDRLRVYLKHDYIQERGTGYTGTNFDAPLRAGLKPEEVPDPRAVIWRGPQPSQDMHHLGLSANIDIDIAPLVKAEIISSYRDMDYKQVTGANAGVAYNGADPPQIDNWSATYWHTTSRSTVQELRFYTPDTARVRLAVGGFYFYEKQRVFLGQTNDNAQGFAGVEFNMPDVRAQSEAGYVDATFDITKTLRATAGVRVTHEHKVRNGIGNVYGGINTGGQQFRFGTEGFRFAEFGRTIYDPATVSDPRQVLLNGIGASGARDNLAQLLASVDPASGFSVNAQHGTYSADFFDWRAGVDTDLTPNNLAYFNVTTGHHSGGFNDTFKLPTGQAVAPTYKPETLYAFELGSKNRMMGRKLTVNAAAFYYLYRDQQFTGVQSLIDPMSQTVVGGATLLRYNAAKSHIQGLEVDASYKLPFGLVLTAMLTAMDARFDAGQINDSRQGFDPNSEPSINLDGRRLPRSPRLTANYSLAQNFTTSIGYFDWILAAQTRTEYFMTPFNGDGRDPLTGATNTRLTDVQPTYTRLDAGVGYTRLDGKMRMELFAQNLTDTVYLESFNQTPNLNLRFFNPPRQYGVRLQLFW